MTDIQFDDPCGGQLQWTFPLHMRTTLDAMPAEVQEIFRAKLTVLMEVHASLLGVVILCDEPADTLELVIQQERDLLQLVNMMSS